MQYHQEILERAVSSFYIHMSVKKYIIKRINKKVKTENQSFQQFPTLLGVVNSELTLVQTKNWL